MIDTGDPAKQRFSLNLSVGMQITCKPPQQGGHVGLSRWEGGRFSQSSGEWEAGWLRLLVGFLWVASVAWYNVDFAHSL